MSEQKRKGMRDEGWGMGARSLRVSNTDYRIPHIFLLLILLLAAFLRFYHLAGSSLWSDEGNTWALLSRSFAQIAQDAAADIHPPGYYWLLKLWTMPLGHSAWAMRSFSALAGVALVYVTYKIAEQMPRGNLQFALLAALLAAVNPFQIYYSQEARMYLLLALASSGLFWALLAFTQSGVQSTRLAEPSTPQFLLKTAVLKNRPFLVFCLCAIAGLWTHYSFPIILAAANLAGVWTTIYHPPSTIHSSWWQRLRFLIVANLLALLAFLPWLPTAIDRVLDWPKGGVATPLPAAITFTLQTLIFGPLRDRPDPQWPWLVGAAFLPLLGLLALRRSPQGMALALWLCAPIGLLVGWGLFSPAFLKFLLVASPAWCIATAAAAQQFVTQHATRNTPVALRMAYGAIGVFGVGLAFVTLPAYYTDPAARDNYAGVARAVQVLGNAQHDLVLLNAPGQQEVWRYYDPGLPVLALPEQRPPDPIQTIDALAQTVRDRRQIFALFWATAEADPDRLVETWLDQHAFKGWESWQGNLRFVTYSLPQGLTCQPVAPAARFGPQIMLTSVCQSTRQQVAPGEVALVGLRWQATEPVTQPYRVTVQLLDERNQVMAQHDGEPAGGSRPTTAWETGTTVEDNHGLLIPIGTPPGAYRLIVALYAADTGQRLPVQAGDALDLGVLPVVRPQRVLPVAVLPIAHRVDQLLGPVRLVGYAAHRKDAAHAPETPLVVGDLVHFTFYWQAPVALGADWPDDLHFRLQLGTQQLEAPLAGGRYPTAQWHAGDLVRGEFDLLFEGQGETAVLTIGDQQVRLGLPPIAE